MKNVLAFLILFTVFSCKKDSDKKDLISKSWLLSAIKIIASNGTSTSINLHNCVAGRTWTFQKDGTYLNEFSPYCQQSGSYDTIRGVWTLSDNNLKIQYSDSGTEFYKIIQLTSTQLVVRRPQPFFVIGYSSGNEEQFGFSAK